MHFLEKYHNSIKFFDEVCSLTIKSIDLENGLAPNRRQAIIRTNTGLVHWHIYASLVTMSDGVMKTFFVLWEHVEWNQFLRNDIIHFRDVGNGIQDPNELIYFMKSPTMIIFKGELLKLNHRSFIVKAFFSQSKRLGGYQCNINPTQMFRMMSVWGRSVCLCWLGYETIKMSAKAPFKLHGDIIMMS